MQLAIRSVFSLISLAGGISLGSCAEGPDAGASFDEWLDASRAFYDQGCEQAFCESQASIDQCKIEVGAELDRGETCMRQATQAHPEIAELLECQANVYRLYTACLELESCVSEPTIFTCADGETIPAGWQCDAETDCVDGSDELGCQGVTNCEGVLSGNDCAEEALSVEAAEAWDLCLSARL